MVLSVWYVCFGLLKYTKPDYLNTQGYGVEPKLNDLSSVDVEGRKACQKQDGTEASEVNKYHFGSRLIKTREGTSPASDFFEQATRLAGFVYFVRFERGMSFATRDQQMSILS